MITLEQHLAAHWPTVHTRAGLHWSHMYQCKCGWMPPQDDPRPIEEIHAAHVADTWHEARAEPDYDCPIHFPEEASDDRH